MEFFTKLDLSDLPKIELLDEQRLVERRRRGYFANAQQIPNLVRVTPTHLGRINIQGAVSLTSSDLKQMSARPVDDLWKSFARGFGLPVDQWGRQEARDSIFNQLRWLTSTLAFPLRLINQRYEQIDAIQEADRAITELIRFSTLKTPEEHLSCLRQLFETDYPLEFTHALLGLLDLDLIPRSVSFTTKAKGQGAPEAKAKFEKINGRVFSSKAKFPPAQRYRIASDMLAAFYPGELKTQQPKPQISSVDLSMRAIDDRPNQATDDAGDDDLPQRQVFLRLSTRNYSINSTTPLKVYIRIEQSGKVQLAKFQLAEKVLELWPVDHDSKDIEQTIFETYLSGPISPLDNFVLQQALTLGGGFKVYLAVSLDAVTWSTEKVLEFNIDNGRLKPTTEKQ